MSVAAARAVGRRAAGLFGGSRRWALVPAQPSGPLSTTIGRRILSPRCSAVHTTAAAAETIAGDQAPPVDDPAGLKTAIFFQNTEFKLQKYQQAVFSGDPAKMIKVDLMFKLGGVNVRAAQLDISEQDLVKIKAAYDAAAAQGGQSNYCAIEEILGMKKNSIAILIKEAAEKVSTAADKVAASAVSANVEDGGKEWYEPYVRAYKKIPAPAIAALGFGYLFVDQKLYEKDPRHLKHLLKAFVEGHLGGVQDVIDRAAVSYEAERVELEKAKQEAAKKKAVEDQKNVPKDEAQGGKP